MNHRLPPLRTHARRHLAGICAIWLTNRHEPIDGWNDTRYDFFSGDEIDSIEVTRELVYDGLLEWVSEEKGTVIPTAKGLVEAWLG